MNTSPTRIVSEPLRELLLHSIVTETDDLRQILETGSPRSTNDRTSIHQSIHRLAGSLGFLGLRDFGLAARRIDEEMSTNDETFPLTAILELVAAIERSLVQ